MPELPEVETVRRGLEKLIVGKQILDVVIYNEGSFDIPNKIFATRTVLVAKVVGAQMIGVRRRAKILIIDLSSNHSLVIHLKMTGQLVHRASVIASRAQHPFCRNRCCGSGATKQSRKYKPGSLRYARDDVSGTNWAAGHPTDSFINKLPDRSTRVEFVLSDCHPGLVPGSNNKNVAEGDLSSDWIPGQARNDGSDKAKLFFNDQRKFGWIKLLPTNEVENTDFIKKLGPEPLTGDPELPKQFITNIRRRNGTTIKAALLDQTVAAGIGNIYADESLWAAKVHPATRVRDLSDKKLREILQCAIRIMQKSINSGGSTMQSYVKADGTRGNYLEKFANVFRREGQPCPRCGATIIKIRVAGRGTHICESCASPAPVPDTK